MNIKVKYFNENLEKIEKIEKGDWVDLRACTLKDLTTKKIYPLELCGIMYEPGDAFLIGLGVAMQLPEGYEAHIAPRGSTFKNFQLLQTNSVGVVDESYCGDGDEWFMPVFAINDGQINFNDRVCQFRIMEKMPEVTFEEVECLEGADRGGLGSTGIK